MAVKDAPSCIILFANSSKARPQVARACSGSGAGAGSSTAGAGARRNSNVLGEQIEKQTGFETRVTVLGHIQRGGSPTAFDRVLGTRFGIAAIDLVAQGEFGKMVSLRGTEIVSVDIKDAISKNRTVDMGLYEIAKVFFG